VQHARDAACVRAQCSIFAFTAFTARLNADDVEPLCRQERKKQPIRVRSTGVAAIKWSGNGPSASCIVSRCFLPMMA